VDSDVLLKIGRSPADGHPLADVVARPPARSAPATMLADYINCPATQGGPIYAEPSSANKARSAGSGMNRLDM
jgi:hypothetical protein